MSAQARAARVARGGVFVVIAGVAGLIIVPANTVPDNRVTGGSGGPGLSHGTYEVLLVLSWVLILLGALVVALSLIDYARGE